MVLEAMPSFGLGYDNSNDQWNKLLNWQSIKQTSVILLHMFHRRPVNHGKEKYRALYAPNSNELLIIYVDSMSCTLPANEILPIFLVLVNKKQSLLMGV